MQPQSITPAPNGTSLYEPADYPADRFEDRPRPKATKVPAALLGLLEVPIAFHRTLVKPCGGVLPALFLSQALYWSQRTKDPDGWFYKTRDEWTEEIGMNRYEQEQARKELGKIGVLEEKLQGLPAKKYYRVNLAALADLLEVSTNKLAEDRPTGRATLDQLAGLPSANIYKETETTSESTSLTTCIHSTNGTNEVSASQGEPEPTRNPRDLSAVLMAYFGRKAFPKELSAFEAQMEAWSEEQLFPPQSVLLQAAEKAKNGLDGERPRTIRPLVDVLAGLADKERERRKRVISSLSK